MLCFAKSKRRSYQSKELCGRILERKVAGDLRRMWEEGIFRVVGVVVISIMGKNKSVDLSASEPATHEKVRN